MSELTPIRDYAKIYPSGTVWAQFDGFAENKIDATSAIFSLFRIRPVEKAKAGDVDAYIRSELAAQAETYPGRVRKLLQIRRKDCFRSHTGNPAHIAFIRSAEQILGFEDTEAVARSYVTRERVEPGSGIEAFVDYAREHASAIAENPDVIDGIKQKLQTDSEIAHEQQQNIEQVIGSLPPYYGEALKRMGGIEIAMNEEGNSSYEDSGLLGIEKGCACDIAMLKNVLPEEIQHFMDAKLGFTDSPAWREAVNQQYAFRMKAPPIYGVILGSFMEKNFDPNAANEAELVAQVAEQMVQALRSRFPDLSADTVRQDVWVNWMGEKFGKDDPFGSSYRARQGYEAAYKELLPDVLRTLHMHTAAGESPEAALAATAERYGRLAELAVGFEKAVEQFAGTGRAPAESFKERRPADRVR